MSDGTDPTASDPQGGPSAGTGPADTSKDPPDYLQVMSPNNKNTLDPITKNQHHDFFYPTDHPKRRAISCEDTTTTTGPFKTPVPHYQYDVVPQSRSSRRKSRSPRHEQAGVIMQRTTQVTMVNPPSTYGQLRLEASKSMTGVPTPTNLNAETRLAQADEFSPEIFRKGNPSGIQNQQQKEIEEMQKQFNKALHETRSEANQRMHQQQYNFQQVASQYENMARDACEVEKAKLKMTMKLEMQDMQNSASSAVGRSQSEMTQMNIMLGKSEHEAQSLAIQHDQNTLQMQLQAQQA